ncbi:hypothetical protein [Streptomyces sp. NBC_00280]|uniref:hypothetical protein n=1 Tax=Streptomyces sp. NBC_00280 TaxID=2975699 RepID=UPI0032503EDB
MTEPTNRRRFRKTLIFGAVAATVAIALFTAYRLGSFEERGDIEADDVCLHVPERQKAAKIFNSLLPRSSEYHFVGSWSPDRDWHFMSTCFVEGESGKAIFSLSAEMGSARPWKQWAKGEIPPNSGGKVTYFGAGLKGVSNAQVAAIWVPCYASEESTKDPWSMTVLAFAMEPLEASDKEARQTLIDLATTFARQAHKDAKCDLPSKLPG